MAYYSRLLMVRKAKIQRLWDEIAAVETNPTLSEDSKIGSAAILIGRIAQVELEIETNTSFAN
jgi:hypothetical protein